VSDRDTRLQLGFWHKLQEAFGTLLCFRMTFHQAMDRQIERTIQTLEDMLQAYVFEFQQAWGKQLVLIEFSYNNSYRASIRMALYEALYGRWCRISLCW